MLEILVVPGEKNKVKKKGKIKMSKSTICIQNIVFKFRRGGKENFIPVKRTKVFF